jgi:hypothetical protein
LSYDLPLEVGANGVFEPVEMSRFALEFGDLESVGKKLTALGTEWDDEKFHRFLRPPDQADWWKFL